MRRICATLVLASVVVWAGCSDDSSPVSPNEGVEDFDIRASASAKKGNDDGDTASEIESKLAEIVPELLAKIEAKRAEVGVELENVTTRPLGFFWSGHPDDEAMGGEVLFSDRGNKQLEPQWVPGDPRRGGRTDIGYAVGAEFFGIPIYPPAPEGLTAEQVDAAADRAMDTWGSVGCSGALEITEGSFLEWLLFEKDILHAGFVQLPPGVLGVAIPSVFVDPDTGEPTDINSDGHPDYAFAQIFYNSLFPWGIDASLEDGAVDVETIYLHEAGHGLAQAHFGKGFLKPNGELQLAPRAVMNAAYSGLQQSLKGTDRAGHCSMYGSWPEN
jgi:hypothetical protein